MLYSCLKPAAAASKHDWSAEGVCHAGWLATSPTIAQLPAAHLLLLLLTR
jgi:hypothetical protein